MQQSAAVEADPDMTLGQTRVAVGFALAGDQLGATAWLGFVVIMAGIVLAELAAANTLVTLVRRARPA